MRNISVLVAALELVEARLQEPMSANELADACYCSCSGLQKLFRYAFHCSVSEYITKRRLSCASRELLNSDKSVTAIALDYQYGSPEAFSRAFKRFWGISPLTFRRTRRFAELQPKFELNMDNGGFKMEKRKPVDITELYDELKQLKGTYILSIDIQQFARINTQYGYNTGDLVIAQAFARLEHALSEDMLLFRIGGDEFAIVTRYTLLSDAQTLANRIVAQNKEPVNAAGQLIPLSLFIGISKIPHQTLTYPQSVDILNGSIQKAKESDSNVAVWQE